MTGWLLPESTVASAVPWIRSGNRRSIERTGRRPAAYCFIAPLNSPCEIVTNCRGNVEVAADLAEHVVSVRYVQSSDKPRAVFHALRKLEGAQEIAAAAQLVHLKKRG